MEEEISAQFKIKLKEVKNKNKQKLELVWSQIDKAHLAELTELEHKVTNEVQVHLLE